MTDRQFVLKTDFYFLARGTMLKQDIAGNYFVSCEDDVPISIRAMGIKINGGIVENRPDIFKEIDEPLTDDELLSRAVAEIEIWHKSGSTDTYIEFIKKVCKRFNKIKSGEK
jgi:hypothetical protein